MVVCVGFWFFELNSSRYTKCLWLLWWRKNQNEWNTGIPPGNELARASWSVGWLLVQIKENYSKNPIKY